MMIVYGLIFIVLIVLSAFFSSSETSILSMNRISLEHKARKKKKKAVIIHNILKKPDSFFSMILFGNNLVNIAAASISALLTAKILQLGEELTVVVSTVITTVIILFFAEIIPKTYAFRYSDKMAYSYAYPIKILTFVFAPFVFIITKISNLFISSKNTGKTKSQLTAEEVKLFLKKTDIEIFNYNPDVLKMLNEIIDLNSRDIKGIMTPRTDIIAIKDSYDFEDLKNILLLKKVSKIPVYKENLDDIIGVLTLKDIIFELVNNDLKKIKVTDLKTKPIFVSEYSTVNYVLDQFRKKKKDIAIVLDEYGVTIGLLTINDIFKEVLGEVEFEKKNIRKISDSIFLIEGACPVEELENKFELDLKENKDYTTVSGLFIYHFGKFPKKNDFIRINNSLFKIEVMGKNKVDVLKLVINEESKEKR